MPDVGGHAGVALGIGDGERLPAEGHQARDPVPQRHFELAYLIGFLAQGHLEHKLLRLVIDQKERGGVRRDDIRCRRDDHFEQSGVCNRRGDGADGSGQGQRLPQLLGKLLVLQLAS